MTLPNKALLRMLKRDFVVGWKDIRNEDFCGVSHGYSKSQTAVGTTNGAGGRNVQIFVLSPDKRVMLALPGFWHPDDLMTELRFAKLIYRLWTDETRSLTSKVRMWKRLQKREAGTHGPLMRARSDWQGFDRFEELGKAKTRYRDSVKERADGKLTLLALDELVHERLAQRPFVPFEDFDTENFVDYGRRYYDLNTSDKGRSFAAVRRREARRNR